MPGNIRVKICGLTEAAHVAAAVSGGAAYLGFVFFPPSPRNLSHAAARALMLDVPPGVAKVALTVNADDATLDALCAALPVDFLQLHGAETPDRVREVRARYGLPVIKAIGIASAADLPLIETYGAVADQLLVDAKPPRGATRPGGNAEPFDWSLIAGVDWPCPWLLAGGLTPGNVAEAVARSGARQVDVSSGVESAPGVKDPARIAAFLAAARQAG
ncbi:MAG: phosphoribosylanthranilate isomerase [Roseovarius sp.]|nr:phosphoribosylanthranilate isomerase [Roseovarius sp.]